MPVGIRLYLRVTEFLAGMVLDRWFAIPTGGALFAQSTVPRRSQQAISEHVAVLLDSQARIPSDQATS